MIEFRVLGALDLRDPSDGQDVESILVRPKRLALLAYMALTHPNGFHHRDTLLGIFWPDSSQRRARRALSQALYILRKGLGERVLLIRGQDEVGIDRSRFWCDAVAFEATLEEMEHEKALELYAGHLMSGFSLPGCADFERWLTDERQRLRGLAVEAARTLARREIAGGDGVGAAHWLKRALSWEPYDEGLIRTLMGCLAEAGDRAGALREYEALEERLASDLDLESSDETRVLAEAIGASGKMPRSSGPGEIAERVRARLSTGPRGLGRRIIETVAALLLVLLGVVGVLYVQSRDHPSTLDSNRVLIAGFDNQTDQGELDPLGRMATDWLLQELTGTGAVRVVLGEETDGPGSNESAISRAADLGARFVIAGSYDLVRDSIAFEIHILDAERREARVGIEGIAGDMGDLPALVERVRERTVGALSALVDDRLSPWASPGASQPPSFEAYRLYAEGIRQMTRREPRRAAAALHAAAAADTTFTAPLIWAIEAHLEAVYYPDETQRDHRQRELADSLVRYLERRRDRLRPWDAAAFEYKAATLRQDWEVAYTAMQRIVDMSPESRWITNLVALSMRLNDPLVTLEILDELDPDRGWVKEWREYWTQRMHALHRLERYEEEYQTLKKFRQRYPVQIRSDAPKSLPDVRNEIRVLAALGRSEELGHLLDDVVAAAPRDRPDYVGTMLREVEIHGHEEIAKQAREWVAEVIAARPHEEWDYRWRWISALALMQEGRFEQAKSETMALLEETPRLSDNRILHLGSLGRIAIALGDSAEALRYDRELETLDVKPFQEPGLAATVAMKRAEIHAELGNHREAIELVRQALESGYPFWYDHLEYFDVGLETLRGDPAYEALVSPKGVLAHR